MTTAAWIDSVLRSARPQAVGALLRYFRDLDRAEEAFQEACLRALKNWPVNGPPRDAVAWLILVGRNVGLDDVRRSGKSAPLPADDAISDLDDAESDLAERLDNSHYRDDVLRLLFICCHPDLPAVQQIALALRVVSGLTVKEIARAFLVSDIAMEQRITRAKSRVAQADVAFEAPGPMERAERLGAVAAMIYLLFNEGYSASGGQAQMRVPFCEEAIRLSRLLLTLFPGEPEIMGLAALLLLQHARAPARLDADGVIILLDDQDRTLWNRDMIAEGHALIEKAARHRRPGPYQIQAAIAGVHAHAARPEETDWSEIDQLYGALERLQPSPVVTLNRAVAVSKAQGPAAALAMIEPLAAPLGAYFHFFGVKGGLLMQLGRAEEARVAFDQAIALAHTPAEAAHIRLHLDRLMKDGAAWEKNEKNIGRDVGTPRPRSSSV
jgi:RNA polymerase sigma-70 factor (ECF subfamily)